MTEPITSTTPTTPSPRPVQLLRSPAQFRLRWWHHHRQLQTHIQPELKPKPKQILELEVESEPNPSQSDWFYARSRSIIGGKKKGSRLGYNMVVSRTQSVWNTTCDCIEQVFPQHEYSLGCQWWWLQRPGVHGECARTSSIMRSHQWICISKLSIQQNWRLWTYSNIFDLYYCQRIL